MGMACGSQPVSAVSTPGSRGCRPAAVRAPSFKSALVRSRGHSSRGASVHGRTQPPAAPHGSVSSTVTARQQPWS